MTSEIAELKAQVETLTAQVENLKQAMEKLMGAASPDAPSIVCRQLTVVDEQGKQRVSIEMDGAQATFNMVDENDGRSMAIYCGGGRNEIAFFGGADENVCLRVGEAHKRGMLVARGTEDDSGVILFAAKSGGAVSVLDVKGDERAMMSVRNEQGRLDIYEPGHKTCATLVGMPGGGALALSEPGESPRFFAQANAEVASLMMGTDDEGFPIRLTLNKGGAMFIMTEPDEEHSGIRMTTVGGHPLMGVVNRTGKTVASLFVENKEGGTLALNDGTTEHQVLAGTAENGGYLVVEGEANSRVSLLTNDDSARFYLQSGSKPQVALGADKDGGELILRTPDGEHPAVVLDVEENGGRIGVLSSTGPKVIARCEAEGGALLVQGDGEQVQGIFQAQNAGGALHLMGTDGARRVSALAPDEGGVVTIFNDANALRGSLSIHDDHGQLIIQSSGGDIAARLAGSDKGGTLLLFDEDGQIHPILP